MLQKLKEVAFTIAAAFALAGILSLVFPPRARADDGAKFGCEALAQGIAGLVPFRDADANVDKVVAMVQKLNPQASPAQQAAIEREIRRMWADGKEAEAVGLELFMRCHAQGGDMGTPS